jgi:hypothetical protein
MIMFETTVDQIKWQRVLFERLNVSAGPQWKGRALVLQED